ncbi:MAG: GTP pyrophosphokinase [Clostridia bacterium]|nr:GTP pyrophosphokinase [Clostridia bacterium]
MIYTELTKKALKISFEAHKNQTDKSGLPYVYHPFHLAEQMETEETAVTALLHDVVEDTDITLEDIKNAGFPESVVSALALMTHDKSVPYKEYIARIKKDPVARAVKLADLKHNSDLSRLDEVGEKDLERVKKYEAAIAFLTDGENK